MATPSTCNAHVQLADAPVCRERLILTSIIKMKFLLMQRTSCMVSPAPYRVIGAENWRLMAVQIRTYVHLFFYKVPQNGFVRCCIVFKSDSVLVLNLSTQYSECKEIHLESMKIVKQIHLSCFENSF